MSDSRGGEMERFSRRLAERMSTTWTVHTWPTDPDRASLHNLPVPWEPHVLAEMDGMTDQQATLRVAASVPSDAKVVVQIHPDGFQVWEVAYADRKSDTIALERHTT